MATCSRMPEGWPRRKRPTGRRWATGPTIAEIYLQLGHCLKLQGRRGAAIEAYQRAARLAPLSNAPRQELFHSGQRSTQERLFDEQLRLGGIEALMTVTRQIITMQETLNRLTSPAEYPGANRVSGWLL